MKISPVQFSVVVLLLLLSGCTAVPVGWKIAALAGSGVSLATTGKTLPDHALSSVTAQDCRLLRMVNGRKICTTSSPLPANDGATALTADENKAPGRYVVIGSFVNAGNARDWGSRFAEFAPQIIRVEDRTRTLYRVAVGPLASGVSEMLADQFRLAGIENSWTMTVCAPTDPQGDCRTRIL